MIGMQRIVGQREQGTGRQVFAAAFHDVVLRNGSVPPDVPGQVVECRIAAQEQAA